MFLWDILVVDREGSGSVVVVGGVGVARTFIAGGIFVGAASDKDEVEVLGSRADFGIVVVADVFIAVVVEIVSTGEEYEQEEEVTPPPHPHPQSSLSSPY